MKKETLINRLTYAHAYHMLPVAHTFVENDELYIKNLICRQHATEQYEAGEGSGWKDSLDALNVLIKEHEVEIAMRNDE